MISATSGMPRPTATPLVPLFSLNAFSPPLVLGELSADGSIEGRLEIRRQVQEENRSNPQIAGISARGVLRKRNGVVAAAVARTVLLKAGVASPSSNNGKG